MLGGEGEGSQLSWQVHCLRETRWGEWLGQVPPPSLVPLVLQPDFQGARSGPLFTPSFHSIHLTLPVPIFHSVHLGGWVDGCT